ncbi:hypothetical protein NL676_008389 [Syzygium grande]|nr:hypothetical protein NL676_008389 [Syzygium grande]
MALYQATVLSLALALILFSALGLSEGRKWKLEKNQFPSTLSTREYKVMGEKDNDNHSSLLQPRGVKSPASASSVEAFMPGHSPRVGHPGVRHLEPPPSHVDAFRPTSPGHSPGIGHGLPPSAPLKL